MAWQQLYASKNDHAYITTMGFNVATFNKILQARFVHQWETQPIPCNDINAAGCVHLRRCSLDAAGTLGLVLHYLTSTAHKTALQEIFALVPATTSCYITHSLKILLLTL